MLKCTHSCHCLAIMLDPSPSRCVYIRLPIHVIHLWVLLEKCAYGENGKAHVEAVALPVTGGNVHQRCDRIPLRQYNVVLPSQRGRAPCDAFLALCGPGLVCGTFSPGRKRHAINNGPEPPGPPATCFYCTSYR